MTPVLCSKDHTSYTSRRTSDIDIRSLPPWIKQAASSGRTNDSCLCRLESNKLHLQEGPMIIVFFALNQTSCIFRKDQWLLSLPPWTKQAAFSGRTNDYCLFRLESNKLHLHEGPMTTVFGALNQTSYIFRRDQWLLASPPWTKQATSSGSTNEYCLSRLEPNKLYVVLNNAPLDT